MIYTLTVNPSLDYIVHTDITPNELNRSSGEAIYPGGKGINVSIMLAHLGCESIALGAVAGGTGKILEDMLRPVIKTDFIHLDRGVTRINVKALSENGITEINGRGLSFDFELLKGKLASVRNDDYFVISGSFEDYNLVYKIVSEVNTSKIIFDIPLIEYALKHNPFFIKPNLKELETYFECEIKTNEIEKYCKRLMRSGCKNILVSLGQEGAFFCNRNFEFYMPAPQGKLVSTVGAGDSMVAGILYGMTNGFSVEDAVRFSLACGSATAFCEHIAKKEDVMRLYS
ncbi:MAG: 1-phosphofructokinase family hexose kinase [Firmicutes bacterium]|nr:1-phosphofructokinase family hexose kinase [Bacillota bacterium]